MCSNRRNEPLGELALIDLIRREKIRAIFAESSASPRLVANLLDETGARLGGTLYADGLGPPGSGAETYVSSVVTFELWYGVAKSARQTLNTQRLETFLSGPVIVLPFEDEDSRVAGSVRAALQASGKAIGAYDILIAGQALARELTLVTANVAEFSRVKGLRWQDWAKP